MSQTLNKILRAYPEDKFLTVDGFNEAVIGVCLDTGSLIYSVSKCIDVLMYEDDMPFEEAVDYFENHIRNIHDNVADIDGGPIWANTEF
jgi:hypothetical protein